jgi:Asp-tRNA(Asn)/Glu-tRNA(Gln) amidotransferase A subunit family amidase
MKMLLCLAAGLLAAAALAQPKPTREQVAHAEQLVGLQLTIAEQDSTLDNLARFLKIYQTMHQQALPNWESPALLFSPLPAGKRVPTGQQPIRWELPAKVALPANRQDLAFYSIGQLAALIKSRQISSVELTRFFLDRLRTWGDTLQCVVSLTEDLALAQARRADQELAQGKYWGPLHGIPYGAKDLLAVPGNKTTWGAGPYRDQVLDQTATVVKKLDEAGAVLVAKLTLGELAMGDVWYGGKTKNPWALGQGSSGSSAGSASAAAAGLVPFAIGTETLGSIVSPSTRCGTTGLRPTFGRVSRYGAMALSWSMDKIGPITRSAHDAAIVFEAIRGADGQDLTVADLPFNYGEKVDWKKLKVGYAKNNFDSLKEGTLENQVLETLRGLGATLVPVTFQTSVPSDIANVVLLAEAAAAFDDLTRSNRDDLLVQQAKNAWANTFRSARFIPAVEYINANRLRTKMMREVDQLMGQVDVLVSPSFANGFLPITNLTGHPVVVVPSGFRDGRPASISFLGNLYDEATILAVAQAFQAATNHDEQHPPRFVVK